ncbi:MAG TPA: 3-isopropylmalate dehydratase small subunit [Chthonomonadales bacterium]|nr:3-isopropylmalate dehydratase small subunit [Chthonomonadales bacterium]
MIPFTRVTAPAVPLDRSNVDTDQIIPKQFLKRIERTGFGQFLFFDWRYLADGATPNPAFELNDPKYTGAQILLAGRNFGCGSSREHAPWALQDYGLRAIIAPSYADIFYNNCFKNGLLPIILQEPNVQMLIERARSTPGYKLTVDLEKQEITDSEGLRLPFEVDPFRRTCLLQGLDDIELTLQHNSDIARYEARRDAWSPSIAPEHGVNAAS